MNHVRTLGTTAVSTGTRIAMAVPTVRRYA